MSAARAGIITAADRERMREERRIRYEPPAEQPKPLGDEQVPSPAPKWYLLKRQEWLRREGQLQNEIRELREQLNAMLETERERKVEQSRALATIENDLSETAIRKAVKASPKYADLGEAAQEYVIKVSFLTRLHPEFEMHAFQNKGKLVLIPDYKALMRRARNAEYLMLKERRMTDDELLARGWDKETLERGVIAVEVLGYDLLKAKMASDAGLEYEPLRGVGVWEKQKLDKTRNRWVPNDVASFRDGYFMAWKRAIRALFYQLTDLSIDFDAIMGYVPSVQVLNDDEFHIPLDGGKTGVADTNVIEGSYTETAEPTSDHWTHSDDAIRRAEAYLAGKNIGDEQINRHLGHDWRHTALSAEDWKAAVDALAEAPRGPISGTPPESICPACGKAPIAVNPFGLCEPCAQDAANKALADEQQQPQLFVTPRAHPDLAVSQRKRK